MANQTTYSLLEARNIRWIDNGDGTISLAVGITSDSTGGGGGGVADEVDANLQVGGNAVSGSNPVPSALYVYDGSVWNPSYGNRNITLLASAERTATTQSATQSNINARGIILYLNITSNGAGITLTPNIQARDPVSGEWKAITDYFGGVTLVGTHAFLVYPVATTIGSYASVFNTPVPYTWRLNVGHSSADPATYSVGGSYIL